MNKKLMIYISFLCIFLILFITIIPPQTAEGAIVLSTGAIILIGTMLAVAGITFLTGTDMQHTINDMLPSAPQNIQDWFELFVFGSSPVAVPEYIWDWLRQDVIDRGYEEGTTEIIYHSAETLTYSRTKTYSNSSFSIDSLANYTDLQIDQKVAITQDTTSTLPNEQSSAVIQIYINGIYSHNIYTHNIGTSISITNYLFVAENTGDSITIYTGGKDSGSISTEVTVSLDGYSIEVTGIDAGVIADPGYDFQDEFDYKRRILLPPNTDTITGESVDRDSIITTYVNTADTILDDIETIDKAIQDEDPIAGIVAAYESLWDDIIQKPIEERLPYVSGLLHLYPSLESELDPAIPSPTEYLQEQTGTPDTPIDDTGIIAAIIALPVNIIESLKDWVEANLYPTPGYKEDILGTLIDEQITEIGLTTLRDEFIAIFDVEEVSWPGIKADLPEYGIIDEYIVRPDYINQYADIIKSWMAGFFYIFTTIVAYKKVSTIINS